MSIGMPLLKRWINVFWRHCWPNRSSHHRCFINKLFLKISQISQKKTCVRVSCLMKLPKAFIFIKKQTPAQAFSCEFCEIFKDTIFIVHQRWLLLIEEQHFSTIAWKQFSWKLNSFSFNFNNLPDMCFAMKYHWTFILNCCDSKLTLRLFNTKL